MKVNSTAMQKMIYDPETKIMHIQYEVKKKDEKDLGFNIYKYYIRNNTFIFRSMARYSSLGKWLKEKIKDMRFPYEKLSDEDAAKMDMDTGDFVYKHSTSKAIINKYDD